MIFSGVSGALATTGVEGGQSNNLVESTAGAAGGENYAAGTLSQFDVNFSGR